MKRKIRERLLSSGALAVGFARAGEICPEVDEAYGEWISQGNHGEMAYLERHRPLRRHTDSVLPGANTVISLAFSYTPSEWRPPELPYIAAYAYGDDYHIALRERLTSLIKEFQEEFGGKWRICIDSAPVAERYWAVKSGIGRRSVNSNVIIDEYGSFCFLVEILTTIEIEPDPSPMNTGIGCMGCGKCVEVCPGKAINGDGTIDARLCINYLTIEKKSEFSEEEKETIRKGTGHLYGCDLCQRVCPHNQGITPVALNCFKLRDFIKKLTPDRIQTLSETDFRQLFRQSPLLYAGIERLKRNAECLNSMALKK